MIYRLQYADLPPNYVKSWLEANNGLLIDPRKLDNVKDWRWKFKTLAVLLGTHYTQMPMATPEEIQGMADTWQGDHVVVLATQRNRYPYPLLNLLQVDAHPLIGVSVPEATQYIVNELGVSTHTARHYLYKTGVLRYTMENKKRRYSKLDLVRFVASRK